MKVSVKYWRSFMAVVMVFMALIMSAPLVFADDINPGVLAIDGQVGGLTYGQWSALWWQYAFSVTKTFDNCPAEPSGQMWFLAGTVGGSPTRSCTVPAGKNIMFPIFNVEWSIVEAQAQLQATNGKSSCFVPDSNGNPITGTSDAALQVCATAQANHATNPGATLEAKVDGKSLKMLTNYRALSPPFLFIEVKGNPFGVCSKTCSSQAVADGFWIILDPPLSAGTHTIHFKAAVPFLDVIPPGTNFKFTTEETYTLTVQAG